MRSADTEDAIRHPAWSARKLLEDVLSGKVIAAAATVKYADGSVRYVPIGQAPDPLAGLEAWITDV